MSTITTVSDYKNLSIPLDQDKSRKKIRVFYLSMGNKLLHHLLQGVFIIYNHLTQPGVLAITTAHTRYYSQSRKYHFKIVADMRR